MSVEGLLPHVKTSGSVWVVMPETDGIGGVRVYSSWAALHDDFPRSPKVPRLIVETWTEFGWAEPGDDVVFTAVQRDVRL